MPNFDMIQFVFDKPIQEGLEGKQQEGKQTPYFLILLSNSLNLQY